MLMTSSRTKGSILGSSGGMILATILVFLMVLTLAAFAAATLTRTNAQLVTNERNEKAAFYIAEAGAAEALIRLGMTSAQAVSVDGNNFDASFTGAAGGYSCAPNASQSCWTAQIDFGATVRSCTATSVTTPTIQSVASRLPYAVSISWVPSDPSVGCASGIRQIGGKNALQITSTGQSGAARRTIVQGVVLNNLSAVTLDATSCPGVDVTGPAPVSFAGGLRVTSTAACVRSIRVRNASSSLQAGGSITVSGTGTTGTISPTPTTAAPSASDPLTSLAAPSLAGRPSQVGTSITGTVTLNPGVYPGGIQIGSGDIVTMNPGVYIMAGGGFRVSSNGMVTGNGVMIYNTCASPPCGSFTGSDVVSINSNRPVTLTAQTSTGPESTYSGITIFQDRANTRQISINSGAGGLIDGLIYATSAALSMTGSVDFLHSQLVVGSISLSAGPEIGAPTAWLGLGTGTGVQVVGWQDF
jgi:Tfp pilus assembly protein PilX